MLLAVVTQQPAALTSAGKPKLIVEPFRRDLLQDIVTDDLESQNGCEMHR